MNINMNKLIIVVLAIFLHACKKDVEKTITTKETSNASKLDSINKVPVNIISSEESIENWAEIVSFESELRRVLTTEISSEKDIELLIKLLEDIKKTYPKRFKTSIIEARVKVLETEIFILKQYLQDGSLKKIDEKSVRIQEAYNIFVEQIKSLILKEKDYEKYR